MPVSNIPHSVSSASRPDVRPDEQPDARLQAELARAGCALWLATLSLMTAYMHQQAAAHRALLARRIARNLHTLQGLECFGEDCRWRFGRLARKWEQCGKPCETRGHASLGATLRNALTSFR